MRTYIRQLIVTGRTYWRRYLQLTRVTERRGRAQLSHYVTCNILSLVSFFCQSPSKSKFGKKRRPIYHLALLVYVFPLQRLDMDTLWQPLFHALFCASHVVSTFNFQHFISLVFFLLAHTMKLTPNFIYLVLRLYTPNSITKFNSIAVFKVIQI